MQCVRQRCPVDASARMVEARDGARGARSRAPTLNATLDIRSTRRLRAIASSIMCTAITAITATSSGATTERSYCPRRRSSACEVVGVSPWSRKMRAWSPTGSPWMVPSGRCAPCPAATGRSSASRSRMSSGVPDFPSHRALQEAVKLRCWTRDSPRMGSCASLRVPRRLTCRRAPRRAFGSST